MSEWPDDQLLRSLAADPGAAVFPHVVWSYLTAMAEASPAAVSDWVAPRKSWIAQSFLGLRLTASDAVGFAMGEDPRLDYRQLCLIRSGLENLRHGCLRAELEDPTEVLDLPEWDRSLEILARGRGTDPASAPSGIPADHWWWRAATEGRSEHKDYDPWDPDTY